MDEKATEFREELAQKAQEYDWVSMPFEEAVAKVLEQEGMKSEIGQNADARRKIAELVREDGRIPDRINAENIDYVRSVLKGFINSDGTIESETRKMEDGADQPTIYVRVIDVRDGKLVLENSLYDPQCYAPQYRAIYKTEITIENGIEMKRIRTFINDNNVNTITYTRNSDLVTMHVNMEDKYEQSLNRSADAWAPAPSEHLEKLRRREPYGPIITSEDLKDEVKLIDEARKEGKTPDGYLYEGEDEVELQKLQEEKERRLKELIEKNKAFKKMAEERGLVEPEK